MLDSPQSQSTGVGAWTTRLEHCPECERDMVQPAGYEPLWGDRWFIARRCPNCEWRHEGVFPHAALRSYEEYLDQVDDHLWDDLVRIRDERIADEVAIFACALAVDAILPEDF
ncbi:MAG TPA: hypothetical protein VD790_04845 [Thermoleophilaceae bacterium]|nr:hypothetical protein [Thermoleophilaceae bacterium]